MLANDSVWFPSPEYIERSRLRRLIADSGSADLSDLQRRAVEDPGWYWDTAVTSLGITFQKPYERPLDVSNGMPWAEWFPGAHYNHVHDALIRHATGARQNALALIWEGDDGEVRKLSFSELHRMSCRIANAMRALGVQSGDRVGIYLPMIPETVASVLACSIIGAVFVPMFSGFGSEALAGRLQDSGASLLVTADGFRRKGTAVPLKAVADDALRSCPNVRNVLVVQRLGSDTPMTPGRDSLLSDAMARSSPNAEMVATAASDPYMLIYTSGTTGRPKGTVHVQAGFPIKAAHDLAYCFDLEADDTLFWLTDLGWMMGPWLIAGGLINGATLMLFEGTPDYPHPNRLWQLVEDHSITIFGVAPTAIRSLMSHGTAPVAAHDRSSLRVLGSTGETWNPDPWRWFFEVVGERRCPIINYSGGTEIGGGIVGCTTIQPQKPCAFTGPVPGMAADIVDEAGQPIRGGVGELVIRQPWVGMTRGFWNDPQRYLDTYWSRFPDAWLHGDWAEVDSDGHWLIRGRSDDTIKVAGKRVGPAEVESAAVAAGTVREAAAIGVPHDIKGESLVVLAVARPEVLASTEAAEGVRRFIGIHLGAALRPTRVHWVTDLPKTRNAKIMRRLARAAYLGLPLGDTSALENPVSLVEIRLLRAADDTNSA